MAGELQNLKNWVNTSLGLDVKVLLIHDFQDEATSLELNHFVNSLNTQQVLLIEKYSGSPGITRNIGIANIDTDWCCFWDADDFPDILKTLLIIEQSRARAEVIISNFAINNLDKIKIEKHYSSLDQVAINPGIWRMIFRSTLIKNHAFGSLLMGEDQIFLLEIGLSELSIEFSNEVNYTYFKGHQFQLTSDKRNKFAADRFLGIIFTRMFITSIKNLKHAYPIAHLFKNLIFLSQLPVSAVAFAFDQAFASRKPRVKVSE
jgi:glycosyltransferase involved in cell wall biosynthesis